MNPIPASSGNTTRHHLNRGGDRQLNQALNVIAMVRMIHDPTTRAYVERRQAEGKTDREIRSFIGASTLMELVPAASRGRMMGRVSTVISLAPAIDPTMSGFLLDHFGWRSIFVVVLPIALVAMFVGWKWLTDVGETTESPLDVPSIILSALAFGGIVYGLSQIGALPGGEASPLPLIISLVVGAIGLVVFLTRQVTLQGNDVASATVVGAFLIRKPADDGAAATHGGH